MGIKICDKAINVSKLGLSDEKILNDLILHQNINEDKIISISKKDDFPFIHFIIFYKE